MTPIQIATLISLVLATAMVVLMEIGRRLGRRQLRRDAEGARAGTGAVEGAVFALLGLLIAFTFSGAATRFDGRKELILQEANAIGTAWLRLDLLPREVQPKLRQLFRDYLDSRLEIYDHAMDPEGARKAIASSLQLQQQIWTNCAAIATAPGGQQTAVILLPALNQVFDIASSRMAVLRLHPHPIVFFLLGFLALASSLMAGFGMAGAKNRSWFHMVGFAVIMAISVYTILDLEFPRLGMIRVDAADQLLIDVRRGMD